METENKTRICKNCTVTNAKENRYCYMCGTKLEKEELEEKNEI